MGRLIYSAICSLDGYVADRDGSFDWAEPDAEVHAFVNRLAEPVGTYLLGRRTYEVMEVWDNPDEFVGDSPEMQEFAEIWARADKVVHSRTLEAVTTRDTRLERELDVTALRRMKDESTGDLAIGGPTLAGLALHAGVVDECQLFVCPVVVGGGIAVWPDGLRVGLDLVEERRFDSGVVLLRHRIVN
jgi:dihydrofolate reductase